MQKYAYTLVCVLLISLADNCFSQDTSLIKHTLIIEQADTNSPLEKSFHESAINYNSIQINQAVSKINLDSLKYLFELKLTGKMPLNEVPGLSTSEQIRMHKKQKALILLTSKKYFKERPNYDLGKVGKYLGISQKLAALILAILSL